MEVRIRRGKGLNNWYIVLVASNLEVLNTSEGYYSHWNAKRAARRVFPGLPKYDVGGKRFS